MIRPGEIYMADFGPAGPPPVIVTSRETLNRGRYAQNLLSIDQAQLDLARGPRGVLDSAALRNVVRPIGYVIESNCEPV